MTCEDCERLKQEMKELRQEVSRLSAITSRLDWIGPAGKPFEQMRREAREAGKELAARIFMNVRVHPGLPEDIVELRDARNGKLLGRIVDIDV